jgi:hypothetical protein
MEPLGDDPLPYPATADAVYRPDRSASPGDRPLGDRLLDLRHRLDRLLVGHVQHLTLPEHPQQRRR